jgi:glutamyl-tRNA reductase
MKVFLAGIAHRTAPVAVREKAAVSARRLEEVLATVRGYAPQAVLVSTCNRTEVYTATQEGSRDNPGINFFRDRGIPGSDLSEYLYQLQDHDAVEHLFRLAAGLESMIIGEYEVLGQVGRSLEAAERAKMAALPLRHLFKAAIRAGRRVREETDISRYAVSVSSVAVEQASRHVGSLAACKMLVIGTGEAGKLVARAARERGISHAAVVGRTLERAELLAAELGGSSSGMDRLHEELRDTDIVISCSGAPHYTLNTGQIKRAMAERPNTPLVIIDIAVPRNIEPSVGRIGNVHLHNIDDLTGLSRDRLTQRSSEITAAEAIIGEEMTAFEGWCREYSLRPLVKAITRQAEAIRQTQLERTLKLLPNLNGEERTALESMTKAIVKKILNEPIQNLKANGHSNKDIEETARRLFGLEPEQRR